MQVDDEIQQHLKLYQQFNPKAHLIYRCVVGSRGYNLNHENSDYDRRGVYLAPAILEWSLGGVPDHYEHIDKATGTDETYWELGWYLRYLLKNNPTVLETLWSDNESVELASDLFKHLRAHRHRFLSKRLIKTYGGYAASQLHKMNISGLQGKPIDWKNGMHLLRLLIAGYYALQEGFVLVRIEDNDLRQTLLAIREGNVPLPDFTHLREDWVRRFDNAATHTQLPELPDFEFANTFLIKARYTQAHSIYTVTS